MPSLQALPDLSILQEKAPDAHTLGKFLTEPEEGQHVVRVHVSSTHDDFHAERDVITRKVLPRLNNHPDIKARGVIVQAPYAALNMQPPELCRGRALTWPGAIAARWSPRCRALLPLGSQHTSVL